jgi:2-keto-4-pentenoate hydratase/2-oxohepta-3-ene-1,7-dioic acid hydratase in catechol pathway
VRIANLAERLVLVTDNGAIDVERASRGQFAADPQAIFASWPEFLDWARGAKLSGATPIKEGELGSPAPRPAQVFGIGLNYRAHAAEAGLQVPDQLATFTKFPSCITGPYADISLPSAMVDWEVELVVIIGTRAHRVAEEAAWSHVAGLTVGQDVSERVVQWSGGGQFSLGKSFPTFGPMGPHLVTTDELSNPGDLEIGCSRNGEVVQKSRTSDMVFSVPQIIARLSAILPLLPGDVIFTGTPEGVGATRKPPVFMRPGDVLTSYVEGIGSLRNTCVAASY